MCGFLLIVEKKKMSIKIKKSQIHNNKKKLKETSHSISIKEKLKKANNQKRLYTHYDRN